MRCSFDDDQGGTALWAQVSDAYPDVGNIERERPPAGAKDWNDALRVEQVPAQAEAQEQARMPARGSAPAKDKNYHDR